MLELTEEEKMLRKTVVVEKIFKDTIIDDYSWLLGEIIEMEGTELPLLLPQCVVYRDKFPKLKLLRKEMVSVVERFAEDALNKDVWELVFEGRNKRVESAVNELKTQTNITSPYSPAMPFSNVGRRPKPVGDKLRKDWTKTSFLVDLVTRTEGNRG